MTSLGDPTGLVQDIQRDHAVPGLLGAVAIDGRVEFQAAAGRSGPEAEAAPASVEHRSRWYSITKPLAVLTLMKAGIDLDAPAARLVPGLEFSDPLCQEHTTLRDCLLHRSGLPAGDLVWDNAGVGSEELLARVRHMPCCRPFRTGFHYQNLHFIMAERALAAAGHDWHRALPDLLAPLGVHPVTTTAAFVAAPRLAPSGPNGLTVPPSAIPEPAVDQIPAAGGICGTVAELVKVGSMMAGSGRVGEVEVVPRRLWDQAVKPVFAFGDDAWPERRMRCAALAGTVMAYRGERLLVWTGGYRGWTSHVVALPERGVAAAALCNRSSCEAAEALAYSLIDRAAGFDPAPWSERLRERKQRLRDNGAQRLAERLGRPAAAWPLPRQRFLGDYHHPAYGGFLVVDAETGLRLHWRHLDLPLVPRPDGTVSADGSYDGSEVLWDLVPLIAEGRLEAWRFNPDARDAPLTFRKSG